MRKYSIAKDTIMPFLEFFISFCKDEEEDVLTSSRGGKRKTSIEKDLKPMLIYKNSLAIMTHFKTNLRSR